MSKTLTPHIKKLNPHDAPHINEGKADTIAAGLADSGDAIQIAQGLLVAAASSAVHGAITGNNTAKSASKTATNTLKSKNKDLCTKTNAAAVIVEQQHPNDPDYWTNEGWESTTDSSATTVKPGIVLHGSATQGDELGTADIHHDPLADADDYRIYVTKGLVGDRGNYIDVTNTEESTSKSSTNVTLPTDYLGVPLNFIIVAHNSAGDGPDSVPFGGGRKIN